ncbi:MAG: low molecular weight protein-tyrosine-phosphatase [Lachnospiraceae bacterium]
MTKILFVCHGNICRSPMAEFIMKDMVNKQNIGKEFIIASAATSSEEIGNPPHHGTKAKLREFGISTSGKHAVKLTREDYQKYDYLIGMDHMNIKNMHRICGGDPDGKIQRLLDFTNRPGDIADPWFSGDFEQTYVDVVEGCEALLQDILEGAW